MNRQFEEVRAKQRAIAEAQMKADRKKGNLSKKELEDRVKEEQGSICNAKSAEFRDVPIVNEEEAKKLYNKLRLGYEYSGMTNDGTQRKIWTLVDPAKDIVGTMVTTAYNLKLLKSTKPKGPWDEVFSYMNLHHMTEDTMKDFSPRTAYYDVPKRKEWEKKEKEKKK
tara:strand:+ start:9923 stop:10423 length:501 start_codon:yes stop_codon:yes gene_type:complete